jgi:cytoplasmic iron level regulating protein YaaA (DUF328/UPF0246 family)
MIMCLSPAKDLDFDRRGLPLPVTQPVFLTESALLVDQLRELSKDELMRLMKISGRLADLNAKRYSSWKVPFDESNAKPCLLAFNGEVYRGMNAGSFDASDLEFAQDRIRILSGLYGLLKPMDLIQPYRLEMGTKLPVNQHSNLYSFWGEKITDEINASMDSVKTKVLLNLASQEYFKAVKPELLKGKVIQPVFKDKKEGVYSIFFVYAKRARGMMSRFIVKNRLTDPEDIKGFDLDGYAYNPPLSSETQWVFTRDRDSRPN